MLWLIIPHDLRQLVKNEQKRYMIRNNPARFGLQWHASGNNLNTGICIFQTGTHRTNRVWDIWKNADTFGNNRTWQNAYSKPTHIISTVCGIFGHMWIRWETTGHGNMHIPNRHALNQPRVAYLEKSRYDGKQPDTATCIFQSGKHWINHAWHIWTNTTLENN